MALIKKTKKNKKKQEIMAAMNKNCYIMDVLYCIKNFYGNPHKENYASEKFRKNVVCRKFGEILATRLLPNFLILNRTSSKSLANFSKHSLRKKYSIFSHKSTIQYSII